MSLNSSIFPFIVYTLLVIMTLSTALGMLKVGNTGNEILQILDIIVEDIEQENINDCAEYYDYIVGNPPYAEA